MFGLGLVGVVLNQVGYTAGLDLTSGSNGALIFATAPIRGLPIRGLPIRGLLLGDVLSLERASWRSVLGLGPAVAGVALVVGECLGSPEASMAGPTSSWAAVASPTVFASASP